MSLFLRFVNPSHQVASIIANGSADANAWYVSLIGKCPQGPFADAEDRCGGSCVDEERCKVRINMSNWIIHALPSRSSSREQLSVRRHRLLTLRFSVLCQP
jgi:hypothetical protein